MMADWNPDEHPRDKAGQFRLKPNGGIPKAGTGTGDGGLPASIAGYGRDEDGRMESADAVRMFDELNGKPHDTGAVDDTALYDAWEDVMEANHLPYEMDGDDMADPKLWEPDDRHDGRLTLTRTEWTDDWRIVERTYAVWDGDDIPEFRKGGKLSPFDRLDSDGQDVDDLELDVPDDVWRRLGRMDADME